MRQSRQRRESKSDRRRHRTRQRHRSTALRYKQRRHRDSPKPPGQLRLAGRRREAEKIRMRNPPCVSRFLVWETKERCGAELALSERSESNGRLLELVREMGSIFASL